jgi:cation transport ATPase
VTTSVAELRARRARLVERAQGERREIARLVDRQRGWLTLVDTGVAAGRFLVLKKRFVLVAVAAFALVQPRRTLRWAWRAFNLFRFVRKLRKFPFA